MIDETDYRPIDAAARDGRPIIVKQGDEIARVRWHQVDRAEQQRGYQTGGMWIYDLPPGHVEQCHITPSKYRELVPAR